MINDLSGRIFTQLTVISFAYKKNTVKYWLCRCSCGVEKPVHQQLLTDGRAKSCGCLRKQLASDRRKAVLTGKRFGYLVAVRNTGMKDSRGAYLWECLCDCGNSINIRVDALISGNNKSCGCKHVKKNLSGKIFNRLTVLDKYDNGKWLCKCSCGNLCWVLTGSLVSNSCSSCGCLKKELINNINQLYRSSKGKDPLKPMGRRFVKERSQFRKVTPIIRARDNYTCVLCKKSEEALGKTLHVHHIFPLAKYPLLRFKLSNLVSLCETCHLTKAHNNNFTTPLNNEIQHALQQYTDKLYN